MSDIRSAVSAPLNPASDALQMRGRHLIEASAGTGKTYNITRLYLRLLLEEGLSVQQILVVTFTKAATEELRGRIARDIRAVLSRWDLPAAGKDEFEQRLYRQGVPDRGRAILHQALLELDEAAIYTIHGFCQRALRQQAFASGLPFQVTMEADVSDILKDAARDYYRQLAANDPTDFAVLADDYPTPDAFLQTFGRLLSAEDHQIEFTGKGNDGADYAQQLEAVKTVLQAHLSAFQEALASGKKVTGKDLSRQRDFATIVHWLLEAPARPCKSALKSLLNDLTQKQRDAVPEAVCALESLQNSLVATQQQRVYQGLQVVRNRMAEAKQQQQLLDFDDLINKLYEALQSEQGDGLASALATQYPALLVDEFQDTDPKQYAIFDRIYRAGCALPGQSPCFFMIGDPKQAIYSFRGGDIFAYLQAREDADWQWQLDSNWRSVPGVVEGYNQLFGRPDDQTFGYGIPYHPVVAKKTFAPEEAEAWQQDGRQPMQFVWFPAQEDFLAKNSRKTEHTKAFCEVMARWVSRECVRLLNASAPRVQARDIAILVRTGSEAELIQQALGSAGLPSVYLSTRDNVYRSEQALDLWRALTGILEPEKTRHQWQAWATPLFGLGAEGVARLRADEQLQADYLQQLFDLRQRWQRQGFIAMALQLLHQHYQPDASQRERALTNTLQLIELLQQASQRLHQPSDLLNYLAEQIAQPDGQAEHELRLESDEAFIRIITHHGSKGLEYPVVFLPFFSYHKDPIRHGNKKPPHVAYHDPDTRVAKIFLGDRPDTHSLASEEGYAEQMRLFYVAITRPVHRCYVLASCFSRADQTPLGRAVGGLSEAHLQTFCAKAPQSCGLMVVSEDAAIAPYKPLPMAGDAPLQAATLNVDINPHWQLSSFSALKHRSEHIGGDEAKDHDRQPAPEPLMTSDSELPRFTLKGGARLGNLLHDLLEQLDFAHPHWHEPRIQEWLATEIDKSGLPLDPLVIQTWLDECLHAPLAPDGLTLAKLDRAHTLRETEFYFPMQSRMAKPLAEILARHRGHPVRIDLRQDQLRGMMHGFIDLIFEWQGRFYVADYKSNFLGDQFEHYREAGLTRSVQDNLYDLQYLLYGLALHRYLQRRLPGYQPEQHLGGVYYLYLRGMAPQPSAGVYYRLLDVALLQQLDQFFSGDA